MNEEHILCSAKEEKMKKTAMLCMSALLVMGTMAPAMAAEMPAQEPVRISLELNNPGGQFLSLISGQDLSCLADIGLTFNIDERGTAPAMKISTMINQTALSDIYGYVNENYIYLTAPDLTEAYAKADMAAIVQDANISIDGIGTAQLTSPAIVEAITAFMETAPEKYLFPLAAAAVPSAFTADIDKDGEAVAINYTGFSVDLVKAMDALAADLEALKTDENVQALMEAAGTEDPEEWAALMDQGIEYLEEAMADGSLEGMGLNIAFGSSDDGTAMNGYLEFDMDVAQMKLAELTAFIDENGITGNIHAGVEDQEVDINFLSDGAAIQAELCVNDESMCDAVIEIDPVSVTLSSQMIALEGLELNFTTGENAFALTLTGDGAELASLKGAVEPGEAVEPADEAKLADAYDIQDQEALNEFVTTIDLEKLMTELVDAGLGTLLGME